MELTFQYEKELCDGSNASVAVMNDETLCLVYTSNNTLNGTLVGIDTSNADNSIVGEEFVISNSAINSVVGTETTSVGSCSWVSLQTRTKQRVVELSGGGEEFVFSTSFVNNGVVQLI